MSRPVTKDELGPIAERILHDYDNPGTTDVPLNPNQLPVQKVKSDIKDEQELATFLTLTVSINYFKETDGRDGLWQTSKRLWDDEHWLFEPNTIAEEKELDDIVSVFGDVGWWPNQDAEIWHTISLTLAQDFSGNVLNLMESAGYDAVRLKEYIIDNGQSFPFLKGDKIAPLWLRLLHEEVHPLDNIDQMPVPVDTHIVKVTNMLLGTDYDEEENDDLDEIRQLWQNVCQDAGLVPVRLDQPMWFLAKYEEECGRDYLDEVVDDVTK